jgi:hypothetical protein
MGAISSCSLIYYTNSKSLLLKEVSDIIAMIKLPTTGDYINFIFHNATIY